MSEKLTAKELLRRLDVHYGRIMSTAIVPEASVGMLSYEVDHYHDGADAGVRRIDALILFRDKRWGIEIKVSKQDLIKELSDPTKAGAWAKYVHCFYFFVTPDLVEFAKANVPAQYGIMSTNVIEIWHSFSGPQEHLNSGVKIIRRAKKNSDPLPLTNGTIRRMGMSHMKLRKEVQYLKQDLADLRARLDQTEGQQPDPSASPAYVAES